MRKITKKTNTAFDSNLIMIFRALLRLMVLKPSMSVFLMKTLKHQKKAAKVRAENEQGGISVPPVMIISVTEQCNLRCNGCYSMAHKRNGNKEMNRTVLARIVTEADELGISVVLFAGGEPLLRPELFDIAAANPNLVFPVFTNGLLIGPGMIREFNKNRNIIPVISFEGRKTSTDNRRGEGVYGVNAEKTALLGINHIMYGISLTVTAENINEITDEEFIKEYISKACRIFFFVEFVPVTDDVKYLAPDPLQRVLLNKRIQTFRKKFGAVFIGFPGDEEQYGGCLAAGRGFIHVSSNGSLEPCPFAPFSDVNLHNLSLREALRSPLLGKIRQNQHLLTEMNGGCALWSNREIIKLMQEKEKIQELVS